MSKMNYLTPKKSIKEIKAAEQRSETAKALAEELFVDAVIEGKVDDATASKYPELFIEWDEDWRGNVGEIVQHEGKLYKCAKEIKNAGQNKEPGTNPAFWTQIGNPGEEFPEWVKPRGIHGAYDKGAKVTHNAEKWVSDVDKNKWEPGVKGWSKYVEPVALKAAQEGAQEAAQPTLAAPGA